MQGDEGFASKEQRGHMPAKNLKEAAAGKQGYGETLAKNEW
jgi:hypothetical protein